MCYSFRYKHRTKKSVSNGHLCANQFKIKIKSQLLPSPPLFDRRAYPGEGGGWDLNLTWLEWEIWTGNVKSFQRNTSVIYFNMEAFRHLNTNFGPGEKIEHTNLQIETLKLKFRSPLLP